MLKFWKLSSLIYTTAFFAVSRTLETGSLTLIIRFSKVFRISFRAEAEVNSLSGPINLSSFGSIEIVFWRIKYCVELNPCFFSWHKYCSTNSMFLVRFTNENIRERAPLRTLWDSLPRLLRSPSSTVLAKWISSSAGSRCSVTAAQSSQPLSIRGNGFFSTRSYSRSKNTLLKLLITTDFYYLIVLVRSYTSSVRSSFD